MDMSEDIKDHSRMTEYLRRKHVELKARHEKLLQQIQQNIKKTKEILKLNNNQQPKESPE